jgi:hypothetical protein
VGRHEVNNLLVGACPCFTPGIRHAGSIARNGDAGNQTTPGAVAPSWRRRARHN